MAFSLNARGARVGGRGRAEGGPPRGGEGEGLGDRESSMSPADRKETDEGENPLKGIGSRYKC